MKTRRKTFVQVIIAVFLILSMMGSAIPRAFGQTRFAGGDGTPENPYLVATAAHLDNVRNDLEAHYKQIAPIDLAGYSADEGWQPIGDNNNRFLGTYDGGGYAIYNLTINRPNTQYQGLFGLIGLTGGTSIHNLRLENIDIAGGGYTGGLIGRGVYTSIENVTVTGQVVSGKNRIGGLAGELSPAVIVHNAAFIGNVQGGQDTGGLIGYSSSEIRHAYSLGAVQGTTQVGGLVGWNNSGKLIDTYSRTSVSGDNNVGGLAGRVGTGAAANSDIFRSFSTGSVSGTGEKVGGLVGDAWNDARARYCYWDTETSGQISSALGEGHPTAEMHTQSTYQFFNFFTLWTMDPISGYPVYQGLSRYQQPEFVDVTSLPGSGTAADPYLISTADELYAVHQDQKAHYRLANDIDLSSTVIWDYGRGWTPIERYEGEYDNRIIFDGDGNAIRNMTISLPAGGGQNRGFFETATFAEIVNLRMEGVSVLGGMRTGALIGRGPGSVLENVSVTGQVLALGDRVGGVAGEFTGSSLDSIMDSSDVYAVVDVHGRHDVGGIYGYTLETGSSHIFSLGSVTGDQRVGGLIGFQNSATIQHGFSRGSVSGNKDVGGLVGQVGSGHTTKPSIDFAYSTGLVSETGDDIGGLVGSAYNLDWVGAYWDMETSGQSTSAAGEGRTTAEMTMDGALGFDYVINWSRDDAINDGYPYLQNPSMAPVMITCDVNPSGWGTVSGCGSQLFGRTVTLVATPNEGYAFQSWTENGQIISTAHRLTMITTSPRTVIANFVEVSDVISPTAVIPVTGGSLFSPIDQIFYDFFAGAFSNPVIVTHTHIAEDPPDIPDGMTSTGFYFEVEAVDQVTAQIVQLIGTVGVRIDFGQTAYGQNITSAPSLWRLDPSGWVLVPSTIVGGQSLLATLDHFSTFALFEGTPTMPDGELIFLPLILR